MDDVPKLSLWEEELTDEQKVKAMVDYFGYTKEQAEAMLVDAGEIDPMEMCD